MLYVRVLVIGCVLSACGSAPVKPVTPQVIQTDDLEIADARDEAQMYLNNLRIEKKRSGVLQEQINMLEYRNDKQSTKLGECNSLINTYENVLIGENQDEEQVEEDID